MKVMTVLGTRPEIIRLSLIINKLDTYCDHVLVHTGQNSTYDLSTVFFNELKVRKPNYTLTTDSWQIHLQIPEILSKVAEVISKEKPDRILILGDTNSGLAAIMAARLMIPVYHMEGGNRCFLPIPEEINRKIIDSISTYILPYTLDSKENLILEGVPKSKIFVTGNPIFEVLKYYDPQINQSRILQQLEVEKGKYFLVTIHRAENVDDPIRLKQLIGAMDEIANKFGLPVVCSWHPRTRDKMNEFGFRTYSSLVRFETPFGFFNFASLEKHAKCVITDSGTVQEEAGYFNSPTVTVRDSTERPETISEGANMLSGVNSKKILDCVKVMTELTHTPVVDNRHENVSSRVVKFLLSKYK